MNQADTQFILELVHAGLQAAMQQMGINFPAETLQRAQALAREMQAAATQPTEGKQ